MSNISNMKVVLSGATDIVEKSLLNQLLSKGHQVTAFALDSSSIQL